MKYLWFILIMVGLGLNGCMDVNIKMTVNKDWSGSAVLHLEMLDQMYRTVKMQMEQTGEDLSFFDEDDLRKTVEEDGGILKKFANEEGSGVRTIDVEIWFKDARVMIEKGGQGQFSIKQEGDSWVWSFMDNEMNEAYQSMGQEELEQQITMLTPMMTGMNWDIRFQVPELVGTNLKKVSGNTVSFELSYDDDIAGKTGKEAVEAFLKMMAPKWVRFKGVK